MFAGIRSLASGLLTVMVCTIGAANPLGSEERKVIALPDVEPVILTYRAVDSLNVPYADGVVINQLLQRVQEATGMPAREQIKPDGTKLVSGIRTKYIPAKHELLVLYDAHEIGREGLVLGQTIAVPISADESKDGNRRLIRLSFPSKASSASKKVYFLDAPQLNTNDVLADYERVVAALRAAEIQVQTHVSGELVSKYRPEAILANFERLVGRDRSSGGTPRGSTSLMGNFLFKGNSFETGIVVTAFPYREGSKVQFSANIPLRLEPDGTALGDDGVQVIQDAVAKVVND
jgi:hypothetical protein